MLQQTTQIRQSKITCHIPRLYFKVSAVEMEKRVNETTATDDRRHHIAQPSAFVLFCNNIEHV